MTDQTSTPAGSQSVASWSRERVVGQLFCVSVGHHSDGAYGFADSLGDTVKLIASHHIGGVCYFPIGAEGTQPNTIAQHVDALQEHAELPLIISIDQEGGLVTRLREPGTRWPSAMAQAAAFGAAPTMTGVERLARMSGAELRAAGVNHVYAPVADVNVEPGNPVIGIRSASSAPEEVGRFAEASVRGYAAAGVGSCLKHFPGHGDTVVDSHVGLPVLASSLERWRRTERIPFAAGIAAGADAVMVGHLSAPGLDPTGTPATFSRPIVTGLLRDGLGFDGVIVTDAMDMAGAQLPQGGHDPTQACVAALKAGIDQVLMPRDPIASINAVLAALEAGELDEGALRQSAARIVALKGRLGQTTELPSVDYASHRRAARVAITRALTWRDRAVSLALDPARPVAVVHDPEPPGVGRGIEDVPTVVARSLREHGFVVEQFLLGATIPKESTCLLVARDAWRFPDVATAVRHLAERGMVDVVVCARSPYDSCLVPDDVPALLAFGDIPGVGGAIVEALIAGVALGSRPVDLPRPGSDEIGWPKEVGTEAARKSRIIIRRYRPEDREAVGYVCLRTGASGSDATGHFFSDDLLPFLYAYPYVDHAPDLCLVVEADGRVVGYVLGVDDVPRFTAWWAEHWKSPFAARFPEDSSWTERERALVQKGLEPERMVAPWHGDHPAELHIDLLPVVQGMGLGRELIDQFRTLVHERGVPSICLGVGGRNTDATAFYRRLGFQVLREHRDETGIVAGYVLWIASQDGSDDAVDTAGN